MNETKTEPITEEELKQNVREFLCGDNWKVVEQRKKDYLANKKKVIRVKKK